MLSLYQRLVIGCLLLLAIVLGMTFYVRSSLRNMAASDAIIVAHTTTGQAEAQRVADEEVTWGNHLLTTIEVCALLALVLAPFTIYSVVQPLREVAKSAQRIGQGDLNARIEWRSRDDLGTIAAEVNRLAVRMRDLRETETGRRQMEHQLSDAVLQSIFEPIIVTDGKGQLLKLNQAAIELLGEVASDRMALTNTPGGDKILESRARCRLHAARRRQ